MMELRPYQRAALDALYGYWAEGGGNGLIVLPTGAGKSLVIAKLVQELLEQWPTLRIGIVTHVRELVAQNLQELLRVWPGAPAGVYSAGLGRRDAHARILFCGIQSVWNKVSRIGAFDVVLIDEAHLIPRNSDTMYGRFIAAAKAAVPDMRIVGLTATPYRLDSGRLDRGDDALFDTVVYDANVGDLIEQGFLAPLISKAMAASIDTSSVSVRGGEFVPGSLEAAAMADGVVKRAVAEMIGYGKDRRAWLAFCSGVAHATAVRDEVRTHGIPCEVIHGELGSGERDRIVRAYREGRVRCLTSVAVLTTGFNVPQVDLIAMLRPTLSAGLYVQIVGRGFRLAPGKQNCLVLDFAGNVRRHGPVDCVKIHEPGKGEGEAPVKECPECHSLVHASLRYCPDCGYSFPPPEEEKHEAKADAVAPILSKAPPAWIRVTEVVARRHSKLGKPDSVVLDYRCGVVVHREWVCIEHDGYARQKATEIWRRLRGRLPIPTTVTEMLERIGELTMPTEIMVRPSGNFHEIVARRLPESEAA